MLALKTASPAMREKIFGNLAQRTAEILQEDMGVMGPVRLKDVERAQARIVAAARRLDAEQRVTLGAHEGDVVVYLRAARRGRAEGLPALRRAAAGGGGRPAPPAP